MSETVNSFTATDQFGEEFNLAEAAKPAVLFFYPKASSPVCTLQSCAFRDASADFEALGATVVGVSNDGANAQAKFAERNELGLRLLSDNKGEIAAIFGLKRKLGLPPQRATVVVGEGLEVLGTHKSELDGPGHAAWALEFVQNLGSESA